MSLGNNDYTIFAAINGTTKLEQNYVLLEEMTSPPSGGTWKWTVTGLSGTFDFSTTFSFDPDTIGDSAELKWNIGATTWSGSGTITVTIEDSNNSNYSETRDVQVVLRTLQFTSASVFTGQTGTAAWVPSSDTTPYAFTAPANTVGDPFGTPDWRVGIDDSLLLDISDRGSIGVHASNPYTWSSKISGTFTIGVTEGAKPTSFIMNIPIDLLPLEPVVGYTVFANQNGTGELVANNDSSTYTFTAPSNTGSDPFGTPDWRVGIDDSLILDISNRGSIKIHTSNPFTWTNNINGTFALGIQDGSNPVSYIQNVSLKLGLLNPVQGFTVFELQNGSEDLVPYDDTSTYTFSVPANTAGDPFGTPDWRVGIDDTLMLDVSNRGSMKVHASNSFTWTSIVSGTITFEIKDGTKTSSYFNLVPFTLALLNPLTSFTVFAEQTGSEELVPATDTSTYSFSAPANTAGDVFGTPDWRVGIDDTLVLDISNRGSVKVHTSNPFTWSTNISGTFTLAIQNGAGTSSLFTNVPLKLAMLNPIPSLTIFTKQTGSEELVPTGDISTYGFSIPANATGDPFGTPDWRVGIDDALALTVSNRGSVSIALTNAYTWGSTVSGTVTLAVEDGTAATSYFSGLSTQLRQLASGTIRITNPGATSSVAVNDSTGETWNWSSATDTLNLTDLSVAADGTLTASPVSPATEITGGDYGSASATVQLMSGGTPAAPACTVPFDVSVDIDIQPVGGSVLPHGRQKMLYQASLDVDCEIESGHTITAAFEGAASNVTDNLELVAHDTIANRWVLQSKVDVGTGDLIYLPTTLPASISVPIKVVKSDGTDVVAQSNTIAFNVPIDETRDHINTAILLDRSGSMSAKPNGSVASRWEAAANGAGVFAHLLQNAQDVANHKLGVYWFSSGSPAAHTMGSYAMGTNSVTGSALDMGQDVEDTCKAQSPGGATALGKGLLLCKTELQASLSSPVVEDQVILAISDGMENQTPLTTEIFTDTTSMDYWKSGSDPNIRIYPLGIMTNTNATTRLKNLVNYTNGTPDVDFTHIETWDSAALTNPITKWFIKMFKKLYGYDLGAAGLDPPLNKGADAWQKVQVHSGQSQVIFYANHNDPNPSYWDLTVYPPNSGTPITKYEAQNTPGLRYAETRYCTMITVNYPVQLPGAEHCWTGEWKMKLTRKETPTGYYDMGALVKEQMKFRVDLACSGVAQPKKRVLVHATLRDKNGKAITDARMTGAVTEPPTWIGDKLTSELKRDPGLMLTAKKDTSKAALDILDPADKALHTLFKRFDTKPGPVRRFSMKHKGNGVYVGTFIPDAPGEYAVDVSCTGYRTAANVEILDRKKRLMELVKTTASIAAQKYADAWAKANVTAGVRTTRTARVSARSARTARTRMTSSATALRVRATPQLSATALKKYESAYQKKAVDSLVGLLCKPQKYTLEYRGSWNVPFVPSAKTTEAFGYMEDANSICLNVTPKDDCGRYLGPGQVDQVKFISPLGRKHKWHAKDLLDGSYEVMIPFKAAKTILDRKTTSLVSSRISLVHPDFRRALKPKVPTLGLKEFGVEVCGVFMPITVFAAAGDIKTREAHLLGCSELKGLKDENLIWFEDVKDIIKHKYLPCPKCIPGAVRPPRRPR